MILKPFRLQNAKLYVHILIMVQQFRLFFPGFSIDSRPAHGRIHLKFYN